MRNRIGFGNIRSSALLVALLAAGGCGDGGTGPGETAIADPLRSLASGEQHACALTAAGEAYCWGTNAQGQLGTASLTSSAVPVAVNGGHRFVAIHAGGTHTCALSAEGAAYCWGSRG